MAVSDCEHSSASPGFDKASLIQKPNHWIPLLLAIKQGKDIGSLPSLPFPTLSSPPHSLLQIYALLREKNV